MSIYPKLFIPGPTHVPDSIMQALSKPQIGHRAEEISKLIESIILRVKSVLYTKNNIYLTSNPATALWEMGLVNSVKKGVLHCVNGSFSSKWAKVSKACDYEHNVIEYNWGRAVRADDIDKLLSTGKYDVLAMVHNETSTGVMSNLNEVSELLLDKYPDVIWLVDAVSSMAGVKIDVDKLAIDFILSSTQKAWGLPAGFSICAVSDKILNRSSELPAKGYYFDFHVYEKYYKKSQTPYTPSIPHLFALDEVLKIIDKEGLENRWDRHKEMRDFTINWAKNHGQELFSEINFHSNTVSCIKNIKEWNIDKMYDALLLMGYRMDRGYGPLRGKAFRIPHMGNIYMNDLIEYTKLLDNVII